jgi:hypothetical protein
MQVHMAEMEVVEVVANVLADGVIEGSLNVEILC